MTDKILKAPPMRLIPGDVLSTVPVLTGPYQVMPPPTLAEYQDLCQSITKNGVEDAVIVDEDDETIDGHYRRHIAAMLGIDCPKDVRSGLSHDEKTAMAYRLNVSRRHLT